MNDGTPVPQIGRPRSDDERFAELEADIRALREGQHDVGEFIDRDAPPPSRDPEPPLECLKFLVRKLSYGDMKAASGDIAKLGDFDAAKLADALHAWATQEDKP